MNQTQSQSRQLRSRAAKDSASLFNFDNINPYVHRNKPLQVSSRTLPHCLRISEESALPPREKTQRDITIHKYERKERSPRKSRSKDDPLDDAIYMNFHNRMTKRENMMVNQDKSRLLSDIEILQTQKSQLLGFNWAAELPKITKINNIGDQTELSAKRNLTVIEINKRLQKYQDWKKRQENLKDEMKFFEHSSISEDPYREYDLPVKLLKEQRREERVKEFGPPIRLNLRNGYSLFIDHSAPPRLVKEESPIASGLSEQEKNTSKEIKPKEETSAEKSPKKPSKKLQKNLSKARTPKSIIKSISAYSHNSIKRKPNSPSHLKKDKRSSKPSSSMTIQDRIKTAMKRSKHKK